MERPGYKTTEFWVGIAGKAISLLIALRVINATQGQDLLTAIGPAPRSCPRANTACRPGWSSAIPAKPTAKAISARRSSPDRFHHGKADELPR